MDTTTYRLGGHTVRAHRLAVPLDHAAPDGEQITVFARELIRDGGEQRPPLLWLQGGPGHRASRPDSIGGWLDAALNDHRVILLDQRGTGLSTPADRVTVLARGDQVAQAAYLRHFRADAIVGDAEALRAALDVPTWAVLGQSYGGFVVTSYLSHAPQSLSRAMITAGLPSLTAHPDEVYRLTYAQTARRNVEYFSRYAADEATAWAVAAHLDDQEEFLPTGERLSSRRFRTLGMGLGGAMAFDGLHYVLEEPFVMVGGARRLSERVLADLGSSLSFAGNPMYAVLHEAIYSGPSAGGPTAWSAHRVRDEFPEFAVDAGPDAPFRFTGEHIYPWQFEEDPALIPLAGAAQLLADVTDFPSLYDADALAHNEVPTAAAVYYDDMFVPREFSLETAAAIRGARVFLTNEYQHDGLRTDGKRLYDELMARTRR